MPFGSAACVFVSAVVVGVGVCGGSGLVIARPHLLGVVDVWPDHFVGPRPSRLWFCFVCRLLLLLWWWGCQLAFTESLILAQDERWRRA